MNRPLAIASAGAFVSALSTSVVAVSAPVIAKDLSVTPADASWVLSGYLLAVSCLLAIAGKAADILGRKRVYLTGFVFFIAGSAMCATAPTLRALIGSRVMQGAGAAMLMAIGPAIVTTSVPPARRARALGIQLMATYIGLTIGPSVGGILAAKIGWQAVFVVVAGAAALGLVLAIVFLEADDTRRERPSVASLDVGGAVLFGAGLAALLVALKRTREDGWTGLPVLAIAAFAVLALGIFARHESLHRTPLLPLELFAKPAFTFGIAGATLLYTVTFVLAYLLPFHLQHTAGLDAARTGAFMTAQPAAMALVAPAGGFIADRWGPRAPSTAGMLAIAAGLLGIAHAAAALSTMLALSLALVGIGAGLYIAPNSALIMGAAPRDRQSTAGAMAATARNVGMTLGIAVAASLHPTFGFERSLFVAAALAGVGALLGFVRPEGGSRLRAP